MKKLVLGIVAVGLVASGLWYMRTGSPSAPSGTEAPGAQGAPGANGGGDRGGRAGANGRGGFGGGQFGRPPMTVELAKASRMSIEAEITVVGNLIGEATVSVSPRAAGRLQEVTVRLGDRVGRGQRLAKIEDFEIQEQVKQAEAAQEVAAATIRQREADLKLAETNAERSRNLFQRQLLPKQTLDDNEARYQSAVAALDLARAQSSQSRARLDELRINLANTIVTSPVNGFVSRRAVDPGAFVNQNTAVVDVVDISTVRLVANIVEKDLKELQSGDATRVEVDAFPGETFAGRIARVSPVLDPATRTAPIEIEIPNGSSRLKPGMYARVNITTDTKKDALVVPANAVVDLGGRRGVFTPLNESAVFRSLQVGTERSDVIEILGGLAEGDTVITTGAGALRDGDRISLPGGGRSGGRRGRGEFGTNGGARGSPAGAGRGDGSTPSASREGGRGPGAAVGAARPDGATTFTGEGPGRRGDGSGRGRGGVGRQGRPGGGPAGTPSP
jgi:HlyD family secretion protein